MAFDGYNVVPTNTQLQDNPSGMKQVGCVRA